MILYKYNILGKYFGVIVNILCLSNYRGLKSRLVVFIYGYLSFFVLKLSLLYLYF